MSLSSTIAELAYKAKPRQPRPPAHLSKQKKAWWKSVVSSFVLEEHHILLLTKAAEAHDRADQARDILAKEGLSYTDRHGQPRARPECNIERDNRVLFARLLRELNLAEGRAAETARAQVWRALRCLRND
jgi:phage terminase small subunit